MLRKERNSGDEGKMQMKVQKWRNTSMPPSPTLQVQHPLTTTQPGKGITRMITEDDFCYCKDHTLVGLEFNGPVNTIKIMLSQSVYLTTLFLGRMLCKAFDQTAWICRLTGVLAGHSCNLIWNAVPQLIWAVLCKNMSSGMWTAKVLIRLRRCAVWSGPLLSTNRIIGHYGMYEW